MISHGTPSGERCRARKDLLCQYLQLQRELTDGEPGTLSYQRTIQAFRQVGYAMITSGLEEDLDRLLRIRVLDGALSRPTPREGRVTTTDLHLIEQVATL